MRIFLPFLLVLNLWAVYNGESWIGSFKKSFSSPLPFTTVKNVAIIPISYYQKPTTIKVKIDGKEVTLKILKKNYPKERLKVSPSKVKPPKKVYKRIQREFKEAKRIYAKVTPNKISKPFLLPLNSKITSSYGNARVFNNTLKSYHSGSDFRARVGTPIKAVNDGVVVLAKNRYFAGNSVIVDHGNGIFSCYYHLSKILVKKGEKVKRGQILGKSGATGRVTAPHLHFTMKVKGLSVNPLQFIRDFNKEFNRSLKK